MQRGTRWQILRELARHGKASVADLVRTTGVSPATIHHHLARLAREGLIHTEEQRHGPGRPRVICSLTESAYGLFPQGYRWLAQELLQAVAVTEGAERIDGLFEAMGERLIAYYRPRVSKRDPKRRLQEVKRILTELGFDTGVRQGQRGPCLSNRHCPVLSIARNFPQLCAMEQRMIAALVGAPLDRTEYRLEGASVCTYCILAQH